MKIIYFFLSCVISIIILCSCGNFPGSAVRYNLERIKENPRDDLAFRNLAVIYLDRGDCRKAIMYAERAGQIDENELSNLSILSKAYIKCNRISEAQILLEKTELILSATDRVSLSRVLNLYDIAMNYLAINTDKSSFYLEEAMSLLNSLDTATREKESKTIAALNELIVNAKKTLDEKK